MNETHRQLKSASGGTFVLDFYFPFRSAFLFLIKPLYGINLSELSHKLVLAEVNQECIRVWHLTTFKKLKAVSKTG